MVSKVRRTSTMQDNNWMAALGGSIGMSGGGGNGNWNIIGVLACGIARERPERIVESS
jgi:hypothetical protein